MIYLNLSDAVYNSKGVLMSQAKFDRKAIIRNFLSKEKVVICPFGEGAEYILGEPPDIQFIIGAFCFVTIDFASVPGLPEMAHVNVGSRGFEYIAGKDNEQDIVEEIYTHAKQMIWFRVTCRNGEVTSRSQRKNGNAVPILVLPEKDEMDKIELPSADEKKNDASCFFFDKVEYIGKVSSSYGRKNNIKVAWYKDISWQKPENYEKKARRLGYVSFMDNINVFLPGAVITGCRDNDIMFEYEGLRGTFGLGIGMDADTMEAWLSVEPFSSGYYGDVHINNNSLYQLHDFPQNMIDDIGKNMPTFRKSAKSFAEYPIVMLRVQKECNYDKHSLPFSSRSLYPASTPDEVKKVIGIGTIKPVELSRKILENQLENYEQSYIDEQHDVSCVAYDFAYNSQTNELHFFFKTDECVHIDRLPTCHEVEEYLFGNVTRERLEWLSKLEDDEIEVDPNFVEWTIKSHENNDGTITFEVGEFPDISFTGEDAYNAYNGLYELIYAEIDRRKQADEPIPQPMTWFESEKYLGYITE